MPTAISLGLTAACSHRMSERSGMSSEGAESKLAAGYAWRDASRGGVHSVGGVVGPDTRCL